MDSWRRQGSRRQHGIGVQRSGSVFNRSYAVRSLVPFTRSCPARIFFRRNTCRDTGNYEEALVSLIMDSHLEIGFVHSPLGSSGGPPSGTDGDDAEGMGKHLSPLVTIVRRLCRFAHRSRRDVDYAALRRSPSASCPWVCHPRHLAACPFWNRDRDRMAWRICTDSLAGRLGVCPICSYHLVGSSRWYGYCPLVQCRDATTPLVRVYLPMYPG